MTLTERDREARYKPKRMLKCGGSQNSPNVCHHQSLEDTPYRALNAVASDSGRCRGVHHERGRRGSHRYVPFSEEAKGIAVVQRCQLDMIILVWFNLQEGLKRGKGFQVVWSDSWWFLGTAVLVSGVGLCLSSTMCATCGTSSEFWNAIGTKYIQISGLDPSVLGHHELVHHWKVTSPLLAVNQIIMERFEEKNDPTNSGRPKNKLKKKKRYWKKKNRSRREQTNRLTVAKPKEKKKSTNTKQRKSTKTY